VGKIKVTLYIRHHKTQEYEKAENTIYPHGTIFVLRYTGKWETLKDCTSYQEGLVAAMRKEIELLTGNTSASLRLLAPSGASSTPRSADIELRCRPVNQPAGAAKQVRDLLVAHGRVRDDDIPDRRVRLRRAGFPDDSDAHYLGGCHFDLAVSAHRSPSQRDCEFYSQTNWRF
jgi:hypothetical protein